LHIESASGVVLLASAPIALMWANSPWRASYHGLWHVPIGFRVAGLIFEHDLHFWVNDVLMVVFFFVVGLEIRRAIHDGELRDLRRARPACGRSRRGGAGACSRLPGLQRGS
jgi:NhaA family Na+:H+ antiporter